MFFLDKLKFRLHPVAFLSVKAVILGVYLAIGVFMVSAIFQTFADSKSGSYLKHLRSALYWEYRSQVYDGIDKTGLLAPHQKSVATLEGLTSEGELKLRVARDGRFVSEYYLLADLFILDVNLAARQVNDFVNKTVVVDVYGTEEGDMVVVWLDDGTPLNLLLIENNSASPVETPPTNIVNLLMASYYWGKL